MEGSSLYVVSQKRLYGFLNRLRHNTGLLSEYEYDAIMRPDAKVIVENPSDGELTTYHTIQSSGKTNKLPGSG